MKSLSIALVSPSYGEDRPAALPVGLAYVAATLEQAGHRITPILMDLERDLTAEDVARRVEERAFDVVGIGAMVTRYRLVRELVAACKSRCPDVPVIVGGKIADSIPERLMERTEVDVVCLGEGEHLAVELMEALAGERPMRSVAGIRFRENGAVVETDPRPPIGDIDALPFPAYHLFPMEEYQRIEQPAWVYHILPGASNRTTLITNRGCPFRCTFCRRSFEPKKVRRRSIAKVIEELTLLVDRYGYDSVIFNDELTIVSKRRALELADAIRDSGLDLVWHCLARIDSVDRDILRALKSAGCASLGFGIESGSQQILDEMNKGIKVEDARRVLALCAEEGIIVNATYMYGMPSETPETVRETVDFIKETGAHGLLFFTTPYPGTTLWDQVVEQGKIEDEEAYLDRLNDAADYVANFTTMGDEEFLSLHRRATKEIRHAVLAKRWRDSKLGFLRWALHKLAHSVRARGLSGTLSRSWKLLTGKTRRRDG